MFSNPGVCMITATFTVDYLTKNVTRSFYAFSTSSTALDVYATISMYYVSQGIAAQIKTS